MKVRSIALSLIVLVALVAFLPLGCGQSEEKPESYGPPQVHFPDDEGAHPDSEVEWWYLNATLHGSDGGEYTAMAAYFRPALRILSISDLNAETFHQEVPALWELTHTTPQYAEGALDLSWSEADRWYRVAPDSASYRFEAKGEDIAFSFDIVSQKPPLMVGGDGLVEWTEGSTYYYSLTRLDLNGQIELPGKTVQVEGIGWMDHQWMDTAVEKGWDWFSIQLDNNNDIICWQILDFDGSVHSRDLTMMFPDGSIYHTVDLELERTDSWTSPETGIEYGVAWRLRQEKHDLDLQINARYDQHEILLLRDQPAMAWQFWEGGATVSGSLDGETVSGIGYVELVPPKG